MEPSAGVMHKTHLPDPAVAPDQAPRSALSWAMEADPQNVTAEEQKLYRAQHVKVV